MSSGASTKFDTADVLGRGFEVLRQHFFSFWILSAAFTIVPLLALLAYEDEIIKLISESPALWQTAISLAWLMISFVLFALLTYGTISELRGKRVGTGESVSRGLRSLFPVLGIISIYGFCAAIVLLLIHLISFMMADYSLIAVPGAIAVIFAGLLLGTMWWIAVPVAVFERAGAIKSVLRSAALTRGHRWQVFGFIFAISVCQFVLDLLSGFLMGPAPYFTLFLRFSISAAVTGFLAVATAVCYHDLRIIKEGTGTADIARVFD